jgi:hypothetical protein
MPRSWFPRFAELSAAPVSAPHRFSGAQTWPDRQPATRRIDWLLTRIEPAKRYLTITL